MDLNLFMHYDLLLGGIVFLLNFILLPFFIIKKMELSKQNNFNTPAHKLNLLTDKTADNGKSLLYSLTMSLENSYSGSLNENLETVRSIISHENKYEYKFSDISKGELILIDTRKNFTKEVFSATKTVNHHVFELKYYFD